MRLGPELFALLNEKQWVGNMQPVVYGQGGLSDSQLNAIEKQLGFSLPPDFRYLLGNIRDEGSVFFSWANFNLEQYRQRIDAVLRGVLFDVEECGDWMDFLGKRPASRIDAGNIVKSVFHTWPKLLPLHSHRFLPAQPCEPGNPVFSIVQTDIVYYGADLGDYLANEFLKHRGQFRVVRPEIRSIPIWSEFVR